jgi:hypothetical protein
MNIHQTTAAASILALVVGVILFCSPNPAHGAEDAWQPPEPAAGDRDWLKLKSGEWVWGDLKSLRDKNLEFDSEELDLLKLDFDDVAEFRSARILTYRFEEAGVFSGTAMIRGGIVKIQTSTGVQELPREDLILVLEGSQREIDFWSFKASLGFVGRSGNSDQADFNTTVKIRRQSPRLRWENNYIGNFGEVNGEENINNHDFSSTLDMLLRSGFFVTPAAVNLFHDRFQNIDLRTTVAAGFGYFIMRDGAADWSVGLGAGYVNTQFRSVQEGESDTDETFSLIPGTSLEWDITGNIEMDFNYRLQLAIPETRNSFHHAAGTISIDIWGDVLDLDFSLTWDRVESPRADADGNIPKRDDFRTTVGIGVDL